MTKWAELWLSTVKAIPVTFITYLIVLHILYSFTTTPTVNERERQNYSQCCLRGELQPKCSLVLLLRLLPSYPEKSQVVSKDLNLPEIFVNDFRKSIHGDFSLHLNQESHILKIKKVKLLRIFFFLNASLKISPLII